MAYTNNNFMSYNPYAQPVTQPFSAYQNYMPQQPVMPQMAQQQPAQQNVQQQAQQPSQAQQTAQTQGYSYTNEIFVTSKEDALNRQVPFNSSVTYLHQDKPFGFQVYTDTQGKKSVKSFRIVECSDEELKEETTAVSQATLANYATVDDLKSGLADLESKLVQLVKQSSSKKKRVVVEEDDEEEE